MKKTLSNKKKGAKHMIKQFRKISFIAFTTLLLLALAK